MGYLNKLFNQFLIVRIFLLAIAAVLVAELVLTKWLTAIPRIWGFLFGVEPTAAHITMSAVLILLCVTLFSKIRKAGQKYARTPSGHVLLLPSKILWFLGLSVVILIMQGLLTDSWEIWIGHLSDNYGAVVVPLGYLMLGILLPFIVGYVSVKRITPIVKPRKGMERILGICSDQPIRTKPEDRLERHRFVDRVYKIIHHYEGHDSVVIGINAAWGEGKTSVLNLLEEKVNNEASEVMIVRFNPWYFADETVLIREFFRSIALELASRYLIPNFNRYIRAVIRLLGSTTATAGPVGINLRLGADEGVEDINNLRVNLQESLKKIDKKVVVVIDDVDRIAPQDLLLVLKLVRLCADLHRFIYVLSFDRKATCDLLERAKIKYPSTFLEKIVQIELRLPQAEKRKLDEFMAQGIDELFTVFGISVGKGEQERLRQLYSNHVTHMIQNLRHAKRLIGAVMGVLGEIKGEVNVVDAIALESLRIFAHTVWEDIARSPEFYVLPLGIEYVTARLVWGLGQEDETLQRAKMHLDTALPDEDSRERRFARGVVEFLFPAAADALRGQTPSYEHLQAEHEREQRVALEEFLRKYLLQHVPAGVISRAQISAIIEEANRSASPDKGATVIVEAFQTRQKGGLLYNLIQKVIFFVDEFEEKGDAAIVEAICQYSDRFSSEPLGLLDSEMDRARILLYAIANKYRDTDRIHDILRDAISTSRSLYFASSIIIWCDQEHNRVIQNFDKVDVPGLKKAHTARFTTEYVGPEKDIFASETGAVRYIIHPIEDRSLLTDYVLSLFQKRPSYAGRLLLLYATNRDISHDRHGWGFQYDELKAKFEVDKLYDYVKAHRDEAYENDDEKWAVEKFLELYERRKESQEGSKS